jgi:cholesterol transport system auxiliary component
MSARGTGAFAALVLVLACAGCSVAPNPAAPAATYDFGPAPTGKADQRLRQALLVPDVSAPAWLDSPSIRYRLAYQDAARPESYSDSRWVMSPVALFTSRLRGQLAASTSAGIVQPGDGARPVYALRVEMDEFTQVFDAPGKSRAVVRIRASILSNRSLVAQRNFDLERPAQSGDAEGGVRALIGASDEVIDQLAVWVGRTVKD